LFFRAPTAVDFGPVFSFQVFGRQRVVGGFHLPNYQITHLPNPVRVLKSGNLRPFYIVKERPENLAP